MSNKKTEGQGAQVIGRSVTKNKGLEHGGDLQDGGGVRRGDHLPPHKYISNTSTCGTTPTKHLLNTGRRPQTSQKARNSPTYLGRVKEKDRKSVV